MRTKGSRVRTETRATTAAPTSGCDESDCAFTTFAKSSLSKAWFSCATVFAMLAPMPAVEPQLLSRAKLSGNLDFPEPIRPHLLHQVFLI